MTPASKKRTINTIDIEALQTDLHKVEDWSSENNMALHDQKFELLCHSVQKPNVISELPFHQQYFQYSTKKGVEINPQSIVKDLGVLVTADISWTPHINSIAESARRMAAWTLSVFRDRSETTMLTLYKSMIRSRLEYNPLVRIQVRSRISRH